MRITSGQFRGRVLKAPKGDKVRPTQDMVREALFSMLLAELPDATFLDLYAGTGAVGIEALSRGAGSVSWVESDKSTIQVTRRNIEEITGKEHLPNAFCADVLRWISTYGRNASFDIVFADPPYILAKENGLENLAVALKENKTVADGGLMITEMPIDAPVTVFPGWTILRDRTYGKTRLVIRQLDCVVSD